MSKDQKEKAARNRVKQLKEFYSHLAVYLIVNFGLFLINAIWNWGDWWFQYIIFFWGIAIFVHGVSTFGVDRFFGSDWEEKKVKEIMDKEK